MEAHHSSGGGNRLKHEKSPYLLQHASNPVDWYPWCDEAFEKAAREDIPVFLSIGYSTCHWCHVMAHESFEDAEVARVMNGAFVSIKVDREERPDIDAVYMKACQLMTGSGGWPLTIIMTPGKKPFFAATYIPKNGRAGRMGMLELVPAITGVWRQRRSEITDSADTITGLVGEIDAARGGEGLDDGIFHAAYESLKGRYDPAMGGFSERPKFPMAHNILFLLRHWRRTGEEEALAMVRDTLRHMRAGGIYDHVGFGFHRYSTDGHWLAPHFEKMLYDQAMLAMAYTEGYQATGDAQFAQTAREILSYCMEVLAAPEGGFYSSEDADSEEEEGKFYLWTLDEMAPLLGDEAVFAARVFNLRPEGNYREETTGRYTGKNIPHMDKSPDALAAELGMDTASLLNRIGSVVEKLKAARAKRVRPFKDDKILADWNGLMIAALAKAAQALEEPLFIGKARKAADFIMANMMKDGRLFHRYRQGEAAVAGLVDDYAFFVWGLIELYEATFSRKYLDMAQELNRTILKHFSDTEGKGLFLTPDDGEHLITRSKEVHDGATPSGNSVALYNLARLFRFTGDAALAARAESLTRACGGAVKKDPAAFSMFLCGYAMAAGPAAEVVIVCADPADAAPMVMRLRKMYFPEKVVSLKIAEQLYGGFMDGMKMADGKTTAYVCRDFTCGLPVTDTDKMAAQLMALKKED